MQNRTSVVVTRFFLIEAYGKKRSEEPREDPLIGNPKEDPITL